MGAEAAAVTAPESPDTPLCAPVAAVEGASGATEPENACEQPDINPYRHDHNPLNADPHGGICPACEWERDD